MKALSPLRSAFRKPAALRKVAKKCQKLGLTVVETAGLLIVFSNANLSISHVYRDQNA